VDYRKVKPGDDLTIPAETYNAFVDAVNSVRSASSKTKTVNRALPYNSGVVKVINKSGDAMDRFDAFAIKDVLSPPDESDNNAPESIEFINNLCLEIEKLECASHSFGVLLQPIDTDKVGLGVLDGIVITNVDIKDTTDVKVVADKTGALVSDPDKGNNDIIWVKGGVGHADETGLQFCVIRISGGLPTNDCPRCVARFTITYTCADDGSWGSVEFDSVECRDKPTDEELEWSLSDNTDGVCTCEIYVDLGPCPDDGSDCDDPSPGDYPDEPTDQEKTDFADACCTTKCIYKYTCEYTCDSEDPSSGTMGEVTYDSVTCATPSGNEGAWIKTNNGGSGCSYEYYDIGGNCSVDGDCDAPSPGDYPNPPGDTEGCCTDAKTEDVTVVVGWDSGTCTATTAVLHFKKGLYTGKT